jgi:hypothetical protein
LGRTFTVTVGPVFHGLKYDCGLITGVGNGVGRAIDVPITVLASDSGVGFLAPRDPKTRTKIDKMLISKTVFIAFLTPDRLTNRRYHTEFT